MRRGPSTTDAPEHKFPAAADDAFAAYRWVLSNAAGMKGDPKQVAVAGESAGGNLAAVVSLRAREGGVPMPVHQLLIYPVTDHAFDTASYRENSNARPLNKAMMEWFWGHYLATHADGERAYASPLRAKNFEGLPPATVITADIDPLRMEGKQYADKLRAAGVPVRYRNFEGVTHEFFGMGGVVDTAKEAVVFAVEGLRGSFRK